MAAPDDDYSAFSALVVDGNPTSRSLLIAQLRDFGVGTVAQAMRPSEGRRLLELRKFDFVLCELNFSTEAMSGQDLLDDLRRHQLLPFSTVFIMITGEATYAQVAEAAESALDGYLLKPHKAVHLAERLHQAHVRKVSLQKIFTAIEEEKFAQAAQWCLERFAARGPYWLYAARIGAELLLRTGAFAQAQEQYQAVVDVKNVPWARLGVARAQLDAGHSGQAIQTLEALTSTEPRYADAYDVLARAQFELGKFDKALEIYQSAAALTPASISRLQNLAMMTYYAGDPREAEALLERTVRLGRESKMFDGQTLVLLAFTRLGLADRKGLQRCVDDLTRLAEKNPENARQQRLAELLRTLHLVGQQQWGPAAQAIQALGAQAKNPAFDFESASNLLALVAHLAAQSPPGDALDGLEALVDTLGLRFCTSRPLSELLLISARAHPPYAERLRTCQAQVLEFAEVAMALSLSGNPTAGVKNLILHARNTLSARLLDNAVQVLNKHGELIDDAQALGATVQEVRALTGNNPKASLGEPRRQAGGLVLRIGTRPPAPKPAATPAPDPAPTV